MEKPNSVQTNPPNPNNKYKEGETVYARTNPDLKLTIRRYLKRIYYCVAKNRINSNELVYFERELMGETERVII